MFLLFLRRCHCVSFHPVDPSKAKLSREEIYFGYVGSIITLVRKKRRVCVFNKVIPLQELSFAIIRAVKIDAMRWDGTAADFVRERRKRREKGASSWSPTRNLVLYETRDVMRNWIPIGRIEFPLEWVWTFDGFELHLGSSIHSPRLQTNYASSGWNRRLTKTAPKRVQQPQQCSSSSRNKKQNHFFFIRSIPSTPFSSHRQ